MAPTECEACGSEAVYVWRHSRAYALEVGRCRECGQVFLINPPSADRPDEDEMSYSAYADAQRGDEDTRRDVINRLREMLGNLPLSLFDVGAGTGQFLIEARKADFEISGNDYSPQAVAYCKTEYGVEISPTGLDVQPAESFDAITMWCVLAHVDDTRQFLRDAYQMLRPDGVLFIRTPRRCGIDVIGRLAEVGTRGKLDQVSDRRLNLGHRHLYTDESIAAQLKLVGFRDVQVEKRGHYSFDTSTYAEGTGGPLRSLAVMAGPVIDRMIERDLFFKNSLFVYARR